jgi:hypothetical protein
MRDSLFSKMRDLLVTKSLKIDCYIVKGLKDTKFRRFIANCYTIILSNGEMCNSDWVVYQTFLY